jgi:hypothetical protein
MGPKAQRDPQGSKEGPARAPRGFRKTQRISMKKGKKEKRKEIEKMYFYRFLGNN